MTSQVSNEMLYDLIRDFKSDVDRRFNEVDKRFERIERKLEEHDREFRKISDNESKVKVTFSRTLGLTCALLSALVSGTVSYSFK